jgi:hypothetical protein
MLCFFIVERTFLQTLCFISFVCITASWELLVTAVAPKGISQKTSQQFFEGFEDIAAVHQGTVSLVQCAGLELDQDDVEDLVRSVSRELTTENRQELDSDASS